MTTHPPRHRLEELLATPRRDATLRAHVEACAECTARLASMEQARAAFLGPRDASDFARRVVEQHRGATRKRALPRALYALAAAAIVLLGVRLSLREPEAVRFKGGSKLQVFVQRAGHPEPVEDGAALAAGDRLAFTYTLAEARNLLLLSIDESGVTTRYFPADARSSRLAPATRAQLPVGIELDAHRGEERLFAFFSRDAIDEAQARTALQSALRDAKARGTGVAGMHVELAAEQSSTWFRKP